MVESRPINLKEKLYEDLMKVSIMKDIEKELGLRVPSEFLKKPTSDLLAVVALSGFDNNIDIGGEYLTESSNSKNYYTESN